MANTFKFGNGEWAVGKETALAYNDENSNFKPLPFTFDRGSIGTVVNKQGLIETVGIDEPRIDFLNNTKGHLLLEPSRQNLITYSEDFSNAAWTTSNTSVSSNQTTSPDGSVNADKLTDNATSNIHRIRDAVSLSASTDYSLSVFAKKDTLSNIQLALINTANSNTISQVFDLENGIIGEELSGGGTTVSDAKIENFGNGWYRCTIVGQLGSTPNQYQISLATKTTGNSDLLHQVTYSGDGTGSVFLYGAQLEQGSYATSYIPTQGEIGGVTRSAEGDEQTPPDGVIGQTEGTVYVEFDYLNSTGERRFIFQLGTGGETIYARIESGNTLTSQVLTSGSALTVQSVSVPSGNNKFAIGYKNNDFAFYLNGNELLTFQNGDLPSLSNIYVGHNSLKTQQIAGAVKDFQLYNTRLSNSELATLTTL